MMVTGVVQKLREAAQGMPRITHVIRGSIVIVKRVCGKVNCRCQKGFKHSSMYISQRYKGKTRMTYIPQRSEEKIRQFVDNWHKLKGAMEKITEIRLKELTKDQG